MRLLRISFVQLLLCFSKESNGFSLPNKSPTDTSINTKSNINNIDIESNLETHESTTMNRRKSLKTIATTILGIPLTSTVLSPQTSNAVDISILDTQAKRFKKVPAFAIVNAKTGTPFMILRNTGIASAYFFTDYGAAQLVLDDARKDAAEKDLATSQTWDEAKISAVSMEFALKLAKGRPKAMAQNGVTFQTVYDIIPTIQALDNAGKIDRSGLYNEQGRVPLFYMNEFEIGPDKNDPSAGTDNRIPVFFDKKNLISEWTKRNPDGDVPPVRVVDLIDTFAIMTGGGNGGGANNDELIKKLYLVPSVESRKKAIECEKSRGDVPAYKTGEMIAVGGK